MEPSQQPTHSNVGSPVYFPTITEPVELSGVQWRPLDASMSVESLRSARRADELSPAHPIIASIRAEAICPPEASGVAMRWWRSWLILKCQCGSLHAIQKMEVRKAIRRGQALYCTRACMEKAFTGAHRTRFCKCGAYIPLNRKAACSDACLPPRRTLRQRTCGQCGTLFQPPTSRTQYCTRACANKAHSQRMIGRGNSHFKTGVSYGRWFRSMRPLILQRDNHRCAVCGENPTIQYTRGSKLVIRSALVIHHIDENVTDNRPGNLIALCFSCHVTHHKSNLTPWPWFSTEAMKRSRSMTSRWQERVTSLLTAYSSTIVY